jgi:hypothetical protein
MNIAITLIETIEYDIIIDHQGQPKHHYYVDEYICHKPCFEITTNA